MHAIARVLLLVVISLTASARTHKLFPPSHESVHQENIAADSMGVSRIENEPEMNALILQQTLVPLDGLTVDKHLPKNRRFALPKTVDYMRGLDNDFFSAFGRHLVISSAVRPATVQKKLRRRNRNAAPDSGDRASSHERGTTVDICRRFSTRQYRWLAARLMYDRALGRVYVIEERACFHIFVGGN